MLIFVKREDCRQKKDVGGKEHIVIYKLQVGSIILPEQPIKEKSQSENLFNRVFRSVETGCSFTARKSINCPNPCQNPEEDESIKLGRVLSYSFYPQLLEGIKDPTEETKP